MIRKSSSAGPCKYLTNYNKKLFKIFAKQKMKTKRMTNVMFLSIYYIRHNLIPITVSPLK